MALQGLLVLLISAACVLWALDLFRFWLFGLGLFWGVVIGAPLAAHLFDAPAAALIGGVLGGIALGLVAAALEKVGATLLGGAAGLLLLSTAGASGGLSGGALHALGLVGFVVGAALTWRLHDYVVSAGVAMWGAGLLVLPALLASGAASLTSAGQRAFRGELEPSAVLGGLVQGESALPQLLAMVCFAGCALVIQRNRAGAAQTGNLASIRRLALIWFALATLAALPSLGLVGRDQPAVSVASGICEALGVSIYTWPGVTALLWLAASWSRHRGTGSKIVAICLAPLAALAVKVALTEGLPTELTGYEALGRGVLDAIPRHLAALGVAAATVALFVVRRPRRRAKSSPDSAEAPSR
jgi:hypothetical protein